MRKLIIDEQPINPKYYEKMSELLDALIEQRKKEAWRLSEIPREDRRTGEESREPRIWRILSRKLLDTPGKRALFDNLGKDEALALAVDQAVRASRQDDWRNNIFKTKKVRLAIKVILNDDDDLTAKTWSWLENQNEY